MDEDVLAGPQVLALFAQLPTPEAVNLPLAAAVGKTLAAGLYTCFLQDLCFRFRKHPGFCVFWARERDEPLPNLNGPAPAPMFAQDGGTLSEAMRNCFGTCFAAGATQVVILNPSAPTVNKSFIRLAYEMLQTADAVIGPCESGGIYLIGMSKLHAKLIEDVRLETNQATDELLKRAKELKLWVEKPPAHYEIVSLAHVKRLRDELSQYPALAPRTAQFLAQHAEKLNLG